ncbi:MULTISPECIES: hypothetical protein [Pseudomonas]|uniref:ABC transporter substrate-binding protein n=4 Tax=Pseudomonas TaxID=286 RepID=A0AAU7WXY1_9PSED|nr:hypothetical protein [Pseudomonas protegens]WRV92427.1 hypothetical protein VP719_05145 [Pseudomonas protegens]BAO60167.1 hypothetical protein PPC_0820 [Pseudomonas protegens Cab57]
MFPDDTNFTGYLKFRVLTGDINFSALVDALSKKGYITEVNFPEGAGLCSSHMEALKQEEFDALFAFFYPGTLNTISLSCIATNKGGACPTGAHAYALINTNVLSLQEGHDVLERENYVSEFSDFDLMKAKERLLEYLEKSIGRLAEKGVQDELKQLQDDVQLIEGRLKSLGLLPLTEDEKVWQTLDEKFPSARSRDEVELDGVRYIRVFHPAEKNSEGKVIKWDKSWRKLVEQSNI